MRKFYLSAFAVMFAAHLVASCSDRTAPPVSQETSQDQTGALSNPYFKMSAQLPDGWTRLSDEQTRNLLNMTTDVAFDSDGNTKTKVANSLKRSMALFAVFENEYGAPVEINPGVIAAAENVAAFPGVKSGADYFFHMKKLYAQSNIDFEADPEYGKRDFGSATFDRLDGVIHVGNTSIHQSYYAARYGDYIVTVISTPNDERVEPILSTLKFDW